MRLVQVNIWCGKLGFPLIDFLNAQQPDIVCMQEVSNLPGHAGPLFLTLDEIKAATNFNQAALAPLFAYRFMKRQYQFCNAVVSKLPITDNHVVFTRGRYTEDFDELENDINIRNFQDVSLQIGGKTLHVINHHGHYVQGSKDGNDETMRQMRLLADYIDTVQGPAIVCGDFNLVPSSPSLDQINQKLVNLPVKYGIDNTYSNSVHVNHVVCDYIFVSHDVKVNSFKVAEELVSDHKALLLEFDL